MRRDLLLTDTARAWRAGAGTRDSSLPYQLNASYAGVRRRPVYTPFMGDKSTRACTIRTSSSRPTRTSMSMHARARTHAQTLPPTHHPHTRIQDTYEYGSIPAEGSSVGPVGFALLRQRFAESLVQCRLQRNEFQRLRRQMHPRPKREQEHRRAEERKSKV